MHRSYGQLLAYKFVCVLWNNNRRDRRAVHRRKAGFHLLHLRFERTWRFYQVHPQESEEIRGYCLEEESDHDRVFGLYHGEDHRKELWLLRLILHDL